jgi:hypothetical protein
VPSLIRLDRHLRRPRDRTPNEGLRGPKPLPHVYRQRIAIVRGFTTVLGNRLGES